MMMMMTTVEFTDFTLVLHPFHPPLNPEVPPVGTSASEVMCRVQRENNDHESLSGPSTLGTQVLQSWKERHPGPIECTVAPMSEYSSSVEDADL